MCMCAHGGAAGWEDAAARTANVQRGEGHVVLERGTQLLGSVGTNFIICRVRGACNVGAAGVRGVCLAARSRLSCPCDSVMVLRGGKVSLHAPLRSSSVRALFIFSAAASSLAPSSPI